MHATKIATLILLATLVLQAGCATPTATPEVQSSPTTVSVAAETPLAATAPVETTAPATQEETEPIKIGFITPLTGSAALDGTLEEKGATLAVSEINAAGGVLGRQIQLIIEDGKADPTESMNAAEKLITKDKVSTLVGCWASSATLAVMELAEKNEIPLVVEISTNPSITNPGNSWTFRTASNEDLNSSFIGGAAVKSLGFTKTAILAVNSDWGRGVVSSYTKIMEEAGGKIVDVEYSNATEVNFYSILNKIKASDADSILITHSLSTMVNIFKQMKEVDLNLKVLITGGYMLDAMKTAAGGDSSIYDQAYGLSYTLAALDVNPNAKSFADAFTSAYPTETLDRGAANAYDAIHVIAQAIKDAGTDDPTAIRDALEKVKWDGVGGHFEFDEQNQAHPTLYITQIQGDEMVIIPVD